MQERPNLLEAASTARGPRIGLWRSLASALTTEAASSDPGLPARGSDASDR